MANKKLKVLVGDFETTVYEGQTSTEVWASAVVELFTENVQVHHSIDETWNYLTSLHSHVLMYYHNLKFDGAFWLSFLIDKLHFKQSLEIISEQPYVVKWKKEKFMSNNEFKYSISDMGQWYTITIKYNGHIIELRDSLKLLPFSVKRIGESFKTKHKKLEMEYTGYRYAGCEITPQEKEYIANDVLVIKEALEIMYNEGHNKLTIGSCCLAEFKATQDKTDYENFYPSMYDFTIDPQIYGSDTADRYIRNSYKGGWCYVVPEKANTLYHEGLTADVNSLYPSMMHSMSGNRYPIGKPTFWKGDYIPDKALGDNKYYFIRVRTRFYLREGYLPCIQIKRNALYKSTEWLETSDMIGKDGTHYTHYIDFDGNERSTCVELTLTMTDYELIKEHYELVEFEILDGCYFYAITGIFDEYIDKYKQIKMNSKGALRELAKLFLNNLYGKMASSTNSSFKVAFKGEDGAIHFRDVYEEDKKAGYIPIGTAITSYARNFTIRTAQKNYHGKHERGFIYADTDSIHCDLTPDELIDVPVHESEFCHWKVESCWDIGLFVRQKTYIEHVTHEDLEKIDNPYFNVKCAGMPKRSKDLFVWSMTDVPEDEQQKLTEDEQEFLKTKRTINDFKRGLLVPSKLIPKRIKGGIVLVPTTYEMR